ncbi:MAG: ATPase [Planctomycetota bacterium]|jgi:trk system potassium uptake protein TrkH|nr:ATPase [Planctomycetota bacterium]
MVGWFRQSRRISATQLVFAWFGFAILAGSILLWLPPSLRPGARVDFISALFTAISAACVTGLTVVNVAETFSSTGQAVIFILMELGGLGIMSFAALGFRIFGRRLPFSQQVATADALYQNDAAGEFKKTFTQILKTTLAVQGIGAALMGLALIPRHGGEAGFLLWSAVFHSVSAFCNGGFTLYRDSLQSLYGNLPFLIVLMILVTLGSLGHLTLNELRRLPGLLRRRERRPRWFSLHTRVTLTVTGLLLAGGFAGVWLFGTSSRDRLAWHALFEAVVGRTAGFNVCPQAWLPLPTVLLMIVLMFIGGSPGSCAGGIKTTSLAIWFSRLKSNLRNDAKVNLFGYTIAPELVSRARILMALAMLWNLAGVFILAAAHPDENLATLVFEQVSAFGTVGLSLDFTPRLNDLSRLWICLSMFVGRLGPLSIALWVVRSSNIRVNRPIGRLMVG